MTATRVARRGRTLLGPLLLASSLMWLGPSSATTATPFRSLGSYGEGGAWAVRTDGVIVAAGNAPTLAPPAAASPTVDLAVSRSGVAVLLREDGTVTQVGGRPLVCPKVSAWWPAAGIALTGDGLGAWVAAINGTVVPCGTAPDLTRGAVSYDAPVVGIEPTVTGGGYYLLLASGRVLAFGDATALGDGTPDGSRFVGLASTAAGYWLARADGDVQAFGDAPDLGRATPVGGRVVDIATTASRAGFRLLVDNGDIVSFGSLPSIGKGQVSGATVLDDTFESATPWTSWWGPPTPRPAADSMRIQAPMGVGGCRRCSG